MDEVIRNTTPEDIEDAVGVRGIPYDMWDAVDLANPNYTLTAEEYENNCVSSVVAYELLRRGYFVQALPFHTGDITSTLGIVTKAFPDMAYENVKNDAKNFDRFESKLLSMPHNSRILIAQEFKDRGNHMIVVERTSDGLFYFDPQRRCSIDLRERAMNGETTRADYARMDNLEFNGGIVRYVRKGSAR